jgi:hypothetical protein
MYYKWKPTQQQWTPIAVGAFATPVTVLAVLFCACFFKKFVERTI